MNYKIKNIDALNNIIPTEIKRESINIHSAADIVEKDFIFQSISWYGNDIVPDIEDQVQDQDISSNVSSSDEDLKHYCIYIHGVTEDSKSVCVKILGFKPYFYVEIPSNWSEYNIKKYYEELKNKLWKNKDGLCDYSIEYKVKLYPFTNNEKVMFMKLSFLNMRVFRIAKKIIDKGLKILSVSQTPIILNVYESRIDPITRFFHTRNITSTGFIKLKKGTYTVELSNNTGTEYTSLYNIKYVDPEQVFSRAMINIVVSESHVFPDDDQNKVAPMVIFSWDIETRSHDETSFPDPRNKKDIIAQIGIVASVYGTNKRYKFILTERDCSPVESTIVIVTKSEQELLKSFCKIIELIDPDIMTGYNTWGYDDKYFWNRIELHGLQQYANLLSRLPNQQVILEEKELKSNAYGDNIFKYLSCHGRETFDVIVSVKKEKKLDSYKLDYVAKKFVGSQKEDLPYRELFKKLVGSPDDVALAAKYCVQDSNLVIDIINTLFLLTNSIEMAKTTYVPLNWLLFRGQTCKVFSLICKKCLDSNYCVPDRVPLTELDFEGAYVLDPIKSGFYVPVAGLDFASLYPSIMIAYNLCYSTLVLEHDYEKYLGPDHDKRKFDKIEWDGSVNNVPKRHSFVFAQDHYVENTKEFDPELKLEYTVAKTLPVPGGKKGILPSILDDLWKGRKATKKQMKNVDPKTMLYSVLDGKQLAQKVTMNSVYGFLGTGIESLLSCKEIACCVTAKGRQMIEKTCELAQTYFPATVVYGDSIPGYEKVPIFEQNKLIDKNIESLVNEHDWIPYPGFKINESERVNKECYLPQDMYTKSKNGITKINKVIRHKVFNKKMYKIKTKCGKEVVVTEGHSLIDEHGNPIQPDTLLKDKSIKLWNS